MLSSSFYSVLILFSIVNLLYTTLKLLLYLITFSSWRFKYINIPHPRLFGSRHYNLKSTLILPLKTLKTN